MRSILVIENESAITDVLAELLRMQGYEVTVAHNGADGLRKLANMRQVSLILLDQQMPLMNGQEFLREKMKISDYNTIPVVVMSATEDHTSMLGAVAFLPKPFSIDSLITIVDRYVLP